ncbi:MAG: GNAT family N-acetyltransferase [Blastomonas sp.]
MSGKRDAIVATLGRSVAALDRSEWDALAGSANPFVSHDFLSLLEESESVGPGAGWTPAPITIAGDDGRLVAALPAYLKGHSQGEYVFDHSWAHAWENAGGRYYPKVQIAVPFTPANGPRLLMQDDRWALPLLAAAQNMAEQNGLSSVHATFIEPEQRSFFEQAGWLMRSDTQFHWIDRGYGDFEGFLGALASRKRKDIRKERARAAEGVDIVRLTGAAIREEHWDAFWLFYQDTGARKWGHPYLTRQAFSLIGERMADRVMLILALDEGRPIAGALNFIGANTLFGRYWGCLVDKPFLHFELCYYQAIDAALELGLGRVEAGAQGGHKMARGYEPELTWSAHYLPDPGFRRAVADFLERERKAVAADQRFLADMLPFRKGG